MKLEIELKEIEDTSAGKLLAHAHLAKAQLKLDRPYNAEHLTFFYDGKSYAVSLNDILEAFVTQLPR